MGGYGRAMSSTGNGAARPRRQACQHVDLHTLAPTTDAPAQARSALRAALPDDERYEAAALGLSELVTNALMHVRRDGEAGEPIELRIATEAGGVRIAVRDSGGGFAGSRDAASRHADRRERAARRNGDDRGGRPTEGGWGLEIVAAIADDWGVERCDDGTIVWFAL